MGFNSAFKGLNRMLIVVQRWSFLFEEKMSILTLPELLIFLGPPIRCHYLCIRDSLLAFGLEISLVRK